MTMADTSRYIVLVVSDGTIENVGVCYGKADVEVWLDDEIEEIEGYDLVNDADDLSDVLFHGNRIVVLGKGGVINMKKSITVSE
jgi:hypothetical protein